MTWRLWALTAMALCLGAWAVLVLEGARGGVSRDVFRDGPTPITHWSSGAGGPVVVVAHGFAGSRQMMQAYALPLAQAGYEVYAFDFEGHGRHFLPMSGDVEAIDGTTQRLVAQTQSVIQTVSGMTDAPIALLGHSMATDVLVRVAAQTEDIGPLVLLSAFSREITAEAPDDMLLITGAWEPGLKDFAVEALQMVDPGAQAGETLSGALTRSAVIAPLADHVSILQSRVGRQAALDWLNRFYDRDGTAAVPPTGWALLALLAAIATLAAPLARLLPDRAPDFQPLNTRRLALVTLAPAVLAPLLAAPVDSRVLPVLVADYLALHLALYGALQLALLAWLQRRLPRPRIGAVVLLLAWGGVAFGIALDRYGANYWPVPERGWIVAALALGTLPFLFADAWLTHGQRWPARIAARVPFFLSLGAAVALDPQGLFFLAMIAPVIVLFFVIFGTMGRPFGTRAGPAGTGIALGLILAWALGVSFPLFAA